LNRACWTENVVSVREPVMVSETVMYIKMHSDTIW
jgi:hypothetical protein